MVVIIAPATDANFTAAICVPDKTLVTKSGGSEISAEAVLHATDGFEVDNEYANTDTVVYYYWAISE